MSRWTRGSLLAVRNTPRLATGVASGLALAVVLGTGTALADPDQTPPDPGAVAAPAGPPAPPPLPWLPTIPGLPALPAAVGTADGQNPTPFTGVAPFGPPKFNPANGSTVGVAQPIIINFPGRVDDAGAAESAVHVSSASGGRRIGS